MRTDKPVTAPIYEATSEVAQRMKGSWLRFLASLRPDQKAKAMFPFDHDQRFVWHYTPLERRGLPLYQMTGEQKRLALEFMDTGLSAIGAQKARAVMEHEAILEQIEREEGTIRFLRDPQLYFFTVFGEAGDADPWGWRVEGHHLSLHFTVVKGGYISHSPFFFGANPARVPYGPKKGLRILANTEDLARKLMAMLDTHQKTKALINDTCPRDIFTTNAVKVAMEHGEGLPASDMTSQQRQALMNLIEDYLSKIEEDVAQKRLHGLKSNGLDSVYFAWMGNTAPGEAHYYRIHGPTFLAEYDNIQNNANHIHSVWRDLENDFGVDTLRIHHQQSHR
jgi:hypothetical protein